LLLEKTERSVSTVCPVKILGVAKASKKDDLQAIKGIGSFIEEKLNALGIYTFAQVGNMTPKIEEEVMIPIC